jgi:hypothetical protein
MKKIVFNIVLLLVITSNAIYPLDTVKYRGEDYYQVFEHDLIFIGTFVNRIDYYRTKFKRDEFRHVKFIIDKIYKGDYHSDTIWIQIKNPVLFSKLDSIDFETGKQWLLYENKEETYSNGIKLLELDSWPTMYFSKFGTDSSEYTRHIKILDSLEKNSGKYSIFDGHTIGLYDGASADLTYEGVIVDLQRKGFWKEITNLNQRDSISVAYGNFKHDLRDSIWEYRRNDTLVSKLIFERDFCWELVDIEQGERVEYETTYDIDTVCLFYKHTKPYDEIRIDTLSMTEIIRVYYLGGKLKSITSITHPKFRDRYFALPDNIRYALVKEYHENGELKSVYNLINGRIIGDIVQYDEHGYVDEIRSYGPTGFSSSLKSYNWLHKPIYSIPISLAFILIIGFIILTWVARRKKRQK